MSYTESDVIWEGKHFWVLQAAPGRYEVLKYGVTCSTVVGFGNDLPMLLRTAQALERYPGKVRT